MSEQQDQERTEKSAASLPFQPQEPEPEEDSRMSATEGVLREVAAERARQDAQWGGPAHDDAHGLEDWRQYRQKFEDRMYAATWDNSPFDPQKWRSITRDSLIKIAALAIAQVEVLDRPPRERDGETKATASVRL